MKVAEKYEVLESAVVGMEPVVDGFAGVLFELVFDGDRYVLTETAVGSGNRLLRFSTGSEEAARALFKGELETGSRLAA
ncbi:MAG: hypothetical protein ACR2JR_00310 [Rubrobacteraceae bacterium]